VPSGRLPKHPTHNRSRRNAASKEGHRPHVKAATPALANATKCHRETKADATRHRYPTAQSRLYFTPQSSSRSRGDAVCTTAGLAPSVPLHGPYRGPVPHPPPSAHPSCYPGLDRRSNTYSGYSCLDLWWNFSSYTTVGFGGGVW
jgi:hypothetical protein